MKVEAEEVTAISVLLSDSKILGPSSLFEVNASPSISKEEAVGTLEVLELDVERMSSNNNFALVTATHGS